MYHKANDPGNRAEDSCLRDGHSTNIGELVRGNYLREADVVVYSLVHY